MTSGHAAARIDVVTKTGLHVELRLGRKSDITELIAGFDDLGEQSRYNRFFTAMPRLPQRLLDELMRDEGDRRLAIVAFDPAVPSSVGTPDGRGIGIARYIPARSDDQTAELAVTVIDEYQKSGVGRVLLEALVVGAQHRGLVSLYGHVIANNNGMLRLFRRLGGREQFTERPEPGVRRIAIDLAAATASMGPRRDVYGQLFS